MRLFDHFPEDSICPVCNSNEVGKCFLMPVHGTGERLIYEAIPVHYRCLITGIADRLFYDKKMGIVYAKLGD